MQLDTIHTTSVSADTHVITAYVPAPGLGILPVNAFVIRAQEPVLVDAGVLAMRDGYLAAIEAVIDVSELRWIWLTHNDPDHVGCLDQVLARAPKARVVTTYLGMGKLGLRGPVAPERVYLLNPSQHLDIGDRSLIAVKPPVYDAPESTGLFDTKERTLFTVDTFAAVMSRPVERAAEIPDGELRDGIVTWATVDAPWLHATEARAFTRALNEIVELGPATVLASHLPPAAGTDRRLVDALALARTARPFVGPDQQALLAMLKAA
jgi:flavorubredoxin